MLLAVRYAEEALEYAWAAAKELPFRKPFLRLASCGPSDTAQRKTLRRIHHAPAEQGLLRTDVGGAYYTHASENGITYPSVVDFSAAVGKAQPRERSAREGLPAEATQCLGPTCVTSPELTSPSIELPFASRVVTRVGSAHGSWVFQGFRGVVPCPHGCRQSLRRKEFASPLGVRVCESLHEKQDRK